MSKIQWYKASDKLPADNQECVLMPIDSGGLVTIQIYGPIPWNEKAGLWMDLFAQPDAGVAIKKEQVDVWADWNEIKPNE